jgi:integrase
VDRDGHPTGISPEDAAALRALMLGGRDTPPSVTLEEARRLYAKEKVGDNEKRRKQLDRIFALVAEVVPLTTALDKLKRAHARAVRDHLLVGRTAASAQRYLNTLKAALTYAAREQDLNSFVNPFASLPADGGVQEPGRRKRDAFSEAEVEAVRAQVMSSGRQDLRLIWRLLQNTGCRLAEITGLRCIDVVLDHTTPHIVIEGHDLRSIKTASSLRLVPLLDDALVAAREAVEVAGDSDALFSAYCRAGGSDSASAALGKYVEAAVTRPKVSTYSLRHRIADLMDLGGVSSRDRDLVLGHTKGKSSEDYGGEAARLELAKRALRAALKAAATRP